MSGQSFLKNIDYLGCELTIYYQNNKRVKTSFGGVISIFVSLIFVLLIFSFGQDFFARKNPAFIKSTISLDSVPFFNVSNSNFSVAFRIEDYQLHPFYKPEMLEIASTYYVFKINDETGNYEDEIINIDLVPCDNEYLPENSKVPLEGLLCPKLNNIELGGAITDNSYGLLEVFVRVCIEGKVSSTGVPCLTTEELEKEFDQNLLYFSFYFQKTIVNSEDYLNGIKSTLANEYFTLNKNTRKYTELFFVETILDTDYGWLIKDITRKSVLGLSSVKNQMDYVYDLITNESTFIGGVGFNFDNEQEKYYREYPKAQNLAAQVGGILKIFLEVGYIVVGTYNLNHCQLSLSDYLLTASNNKVGRKLSATNNLYNDRKNTYPNNNNNKIHASTFVNINESKQCISGNNMFSNNNNISVSHFNLNSNFEGDIKREEVNNKIILKDGKYDSEKVHENRKDTNEVTNNLFFKSSLIQGQPTKFRPSYHKCNSEKLGVNDTLDLNCNKAVVKEGNKSCLYEKDFDEKVSLNILSLINTFNIY